MKYLVAIEVDSDREIFEFNTKEDRAAFIKEIKGKVDDYITSEVKA